jgi:cytochrome c-type biogenesis protein CcmH
MIRGMVDGLALRLDKSPRDADGWIQLIRSRTVLGDQDAAKAALQKALGIFIDAPQEQSRISAAATELGVNQ